MCIINVIQLLCVSLMSFSFLMEEDTMDNYRRMIQTKHNSICNIVFVLFTHVSQPPMVAGPSTLFSLFVNGYSADEMFRSDQIVDCHL